jgi:endonuclease/exonuclease/phosphatase family metal-dependent hydrolase
VRSGTSRAEDRGEWSRPRSVSTVPDAPALRIGTLNLASGRGRSGRPLAEEQLRAAVAALGVDILALQEVDAGQPRSHGLDQAAVVAAVLDADWRMAATVAGTPSPVRDWQPIEPALRGPGQPAGSPVYGVALVSRRPVRRWHVLGLGAGRARLPLQALDPRTGKAGWWWIPDEPRVAVAAEVDGATVVSTHLSFAPHTSVRQLRRLRRWAAELPGPVVLAGDLNLPAGVAARVAGARPLVRARTFPAHEPRVQLDHLLAVGQGLTLLDGCAARLAVGDHRALLASIR